MPVNSNRPPPMSAGLNDSATVASSVGGGGGNRSTKGDVTERKKPTTSLWSYILPSPVESNPTDASITINTASEKEKEKQHLPTTSPADRNAISIRLALGDTQSAVQTLADRVDRVLDLQRDEAKSVRDEIGRVVQSVERAFTALGEATAAHTSKLDETLSRILQVESTLSVQSAAMTELGAKCDVHFSVRLRPNNLLADYGFINLCDDARVVGKELNKFSSLPHIIPVLQSLPSSIHNNHLSTTQALERSSQNQTHVLSVETSRWMSEHQSATKASLDKLKEEVRHALEANREAWSVALSLHRQEMSAMFSAVLAGIRAVAGPIGADSISGSGSASTTTGSSSSVQRAQTQIVVDGITTARARESDTPQTTALDGTTPHTFKPHGHPSSITHSHSQERVATKSEKPHVAQHAAKNSNAQAARHIQASPVHGKNSPRSEVLQPGLVLVEDTQSTALSSVPDEEEIVERMPSRGFGALGERASSTLGSFANPGSPGFTVHRQPFVRGSNLRPALDPTRKKSDERVSETGSRFESLAPTFGRPSSPGNEPSIRLVVKKRTTSVEDVPPAPTKRSRKAKTRVLMDSQELLMLDSSPER
ncbi:unnamed protein product [Rhizoctonia solani]|uniref:Uncharacterized protein n=1 Tax=Rhizoctonia solani TaxID=456999 RepID=A0A8H2XY02_9AGAM|nr:unnamed protein product [Rhizoctonia solani]